MSAFSPLLIVSRLIEGRCGTQAIWEIAQLLWYLLVRRTILSCFRDAGEDETLHQNRGLCPPLPMDRGTTRCPSRHRTTTSPLARILSSRREDSKHCHCRRFLCRLPSGPGHCRGPTSPKPIPSRSRRAKQPFPFHLGAAEILRCQGPRTQGVHSIWRLHGWRSRGFLPLGKGQGCRH